MKTLSLDELIGNLQTYELRRNSQQQEETKKDRGLALKIMEDDSSNLDEDDMAMVARKFKKFFKKTKVGIRQKQLRRSKSTDKKISSPGVSSATRWIILSKIVPS